VHFAVSVAVALGCGLIPWAATRLPNRWAAIAAAPLLVVIAIGVVFGLPLYPISDVIVVLFSVLAGLLVGRAMPPRFAPFLVLLLVLSVLDVAQNAVFSGPSTGPSTSSPGVPDPHFIWLNLRFPLPTGHFNLGFADLLLIAAVSEHLRRRKSPLPLALLPGVIGLGLGEAVAASLPSSPPLLLTALTQSVMPFLTAGYVLSELAVSQTQSDTSDPLSG
jgi:hypothetical protein